MNKNIELQLLRAIAVTFAMIEHIPFLYVSALNPLRPYFGFWCGVDLFFVISGFVITKSLYPLLNSVQTGGDWKRHLQLFWIKRVFRILPAAWLWLALTLVIAALLNGTAMFPQFSTTLKDAAAGLFNYANFHWAACWVNQTFGKTCSGPAVLAHYWTLSLEEQFYLVYPILLIIVPNRIRSLLIISLILYLSTVIRGPLGWGWHNRIDGLAWGVLLALYLKDKELPVIHSTALLHALRISAPLLLLALLWWAGGGTTWYQAHWHAFPRFWLALLAFISMLLVLLAIFQQQLIWLPAPLRRIVSNIGDRSYALYLAHCPSFALVKSIAIFLGFQHGWISVLGTICMGFVVSYLLAELTYRWVEVPCRKFGTHLATQQTSTAAIKL